MPRPRDTLGAWLLTAVWTDLRFAIRSSRRRQRSRLPPPWCWRWASLNTAVFSVIETTLLRPVPYDAPEALVLINERSPVSERERVAFEDYRDWRRDTTAFEALAAANSETFNLTGMGIRNRCRGPMCARRSSKCCA